LIIVSTKDLKTRHQAGFLLLVAAKMKELRFD